MIFVDTGVWYAAFVEEDSDHERCKSLISKAAGSLVTTDYIIDELLTLMSVRAHRKLAASLGQRLWNEDYADLHLITRDDIRDAWRVFTEFDDKHWSFTDCTSYSVMQRLDITEALALDDHFRQFGFVTVYP